MYNGLFQILQLLNLNRETLNMPASTNTEAQLNAALSKVIITFLEAVAL